MDDLALSNVMHRKTRTVLSSAGVALGVILVVLTVGLVHGFLSEQGTRNAAVTAEIMFNPPGSTFGLDLSPNLSMPATLADQLKALPGVEAAVPVGHYIKGRLVDGINFDDFSKVSNVKVVEGRPVQSGDEAIIDRVLQSSRKAKVGGTIDIFDRPFKVVGVYEPESLGRVKIPLATLQQSLNRPGLCSMVFVKLKDPSKTDETVQLIRDRFPGYSIYLTRELPSLYEAGTPALRTFLNVVVALSIIISTLVILLAMYTTVTERTRQIGILKSLGASRVWIAGEIQKEALMITLIGVIVGFGVSAVGKYAIQRFAGLTVELEIVWLFYALGLGIISGALGAMYPALRAAKQDPVKALSYE